MNLFDVLLGIFASLTILVIAMIIFNIASMGISAAFSTYNYLLKITLGGEAHYLGWNSEKQRIEVGKCDSLIPIWFEYLKYQDSSSETFSVKIPNNCLYISIDESSAQSSGSKYIFDVLKIDYENSNSISSSSKARFLTDDDNRKHLVIGGYLLKFQKIDDQVQVQTQKTSKMQINSDQDVEFVDALDVECSNSSFSCPSK